MALSAQNYSQGSKSSCLEYLVVQALNDDNSVVALHPKTMEVLELFRGDTVLLKVVNGVVECMPLAFIGLFFLRT